MLPLAGVMVIEVTFEAFTVSEVLPVTPPNVALMVVLPRPTPVTNPLTVIDATPLLEECHCATLVTSCVLPSENVPLAVNC